MKFAKIKIFKGDWLSQLRAVNVRFRLFGVNIGFVIGAEAGRGWTDGRMEVLPWQPQRQYIDVSTLFEGDALNSLERFLGELGSLSSIELDMLESALHALLKDHDKLGVPMPHNVWNAGCELMNACGFAFAKRRRYEAWMRAEFEDSKGFPPDPITGEPYTEVSV